MANELEVSSTINRNDEQQGTKATGATGGPEA
jgi:hypothetical protein